MHRKCLDLDEVEKLVDTVFVFYITSVARIETARNLLAAYTISSSFVTRYSRDYTYPKVCNNIIHQQTIMVCSTIPLRSFNCSH